MRHVFVMDPIDRIRIDQDSTFALMLEAQSRGHEVYYAEAKHLFVRDSKAFCKVARCTVHPVQGEHASLAEAVDSNLGGFDVVWMRKDPPFDMDYIFATYVLDLAELETLVVNAPAGLRNMNEKAWPMRFNEWIPESLITQSEPRLRDFVNELGTAVIKPLDGCGGEGVFIADNQDPNIGVIIEMSTAHGTRKVMAQRYLPEAKAGDKRIILVDGEVVGAMLRVPQGVDHRGNMHVGAAVVAAEITARDAEICRAIGPPLRDAGQLFVGIDVIGAYLTEVNVTSPTGIHEINALDGVCLEALVMDAAEARRSASP